MAGQVSLANQRPTGRGLGRILAPFASGTEAPSRLQVHLLSHSGIHTLYIACLYPASVVSLYTCSC